MARPSPGRARYTRGAWQTRPYAPWTLDTPTGGEQGPQALRRHPTPSLPNPAWQSCKNLRRKQQRGGARAGSCKRLRTPPGLAGRSLAPRRRGPRAHFAPGSRPRWSGAGWGDGAPQVALTNNTNPCQPPAPMVQRPLPRCPKSGKIGCEAHRRSGTAGTPRGLLPRWRG